MPIVYLSPSNQAGNKYAAGNTNEKAQCEKIAIAAAAALERCGIAALNGAGVNSYGDRVATAKAAKCDLYMPIHTNASPKHNATGTRVFVRSFKDEPSYKYAKVIFKYLDAACPGTSSKIKTYPTLWEFTATEPMPAVYCECDFHDVAAIAEYIINHTTDIGEAIARGICECFDVPYIGPEPPLKVGDLVRIKAGAKNYTGTKTFSKWVYASKLYVRQINGDRIVVSIFKIGAVTGAVNINDLIRL